MRRQKRCDQAGKRNKMKRQKFSLTLLLVAFRWEEENENWMIQGKQKRKKEEKEKKKEKKWKKKKRQKFYLILLVVAFRWGIKYYNYEYELHDSFQSEYWSEECFSKKAKTWMRLIIVGGIINFPCMKSQYLWSLGKLGVEGWYDGPSWVTCLLLLMYPALLTFSGRPPFSCFISSCPGPEGEPFLWHDGALFKLLHCWFPIMPTFNGGNTLALSLLNIVLHHLTAGERLQQKEMMAASFRPWSRRLLICMSLNMYLSALLDEDITSLQTGNLLNVRRGNILYGSTWK